MANFDERLRDIIIKLHEIEALKFGLFKMKVGIDSPVYFDMRNIVSYPDVLECLASLLWDFAKDDFKDKKICGVPYAALPLATLISVQAKIPMLIRRKEAKKYGTKKLIEGKFSLGDRCIIVEDVVTSGSSILETVKDLRSEGLNINSAIAVVDREQGGTHNLFAENITVRSLCTLSKVLCILKEAGKIDKEAVESVKKYLAVSQIRPDGSFLTLPKVSRLTVPFDKRAEQATNTVAAKLFHLMESKSSNLCVAADITKAKDLISLANSIGPYICILKTHIDIIEDFTSDLIDSLVSVAQQHNFLLMEDRKFADIGHTVSLQYSRGIYKISSWADLVTVHPVPGEGVIIGLKSEVSNQQKGCFLVAEMSSAGNLNTANYIASTLEMCAKHEDFVVGMVCQSSTIVKQPGLIQLTPGVKMDFSSDDNLGQQYDSPNNVIISRGADIAVVGRGITQTDNPAIAAKQYQAELWAAYKKRLNV